MTTKKKSNIYILDNGEPYSDHQITFVESSFDQEKVEQLIRGLGSDEIIAVCKKVDWYEGEPLSLEEYVGKGTYFVLGKYTALFKQMPVDMLEAIAAVRKKYIQNYSSLHWSDEKKLEEIEKQLSALYLIIESKKVPF